MDVGNVLETYWKRVGNVSTVASAVRFQLLSLGKHHYKIQAQAHPLTVYRARHRSGYMRARRVCRTMVVRRLRGGAMAVLGVRGTMWKPRLAMVVELRFTTEP